MRRASAPACIRRMYFSYCRSDQILLSVRVILSWKANICAYEALTQSSSAVIEIFGVCDA